MKGKVLITVMAGMLFLSFLSSIAKAVPGGIPTCTDTLNVCMTNLGACTTNLSSCTTNFAVCNTSLTEAHANLATCQETIAQCIQRTSPPSWDKKLTCDSTSNCPRFEVLADWGNEAVLDKETGLVWDRYPANSPPHQWDPATCYVKLIGGRQGWRYPTIEELASLVDLSQSPALPSGHPFVGVFPMPYWSATTYTGFLQNSLDFAYGVDFSSGAVFHSPKGGIDIARDWCVRGGQGYDGR